MSTHDVPGAVAAHNDVLAMGCWGEHADGSLIFVQSTENGRVIYMMFDTAEDPVIEYRDAMPEADFKSTFSWSAEAKPSKKNKKVGAVADVKWTWHDKTPFPWDRVIKQGAKNGARFASADDQLSAAARVAASLNLRAKALDPKDVEHMADQSRPLNKVRKLVKKLGDALGKLDA